MSESREKCYDKDFFLKIRGLDLTRKDLMEALLSLPPYQLEQLLHDLGKEADLGLSLDRQIDIPTFEQSNFRLSEDVTKHWIESKAYALINGQRKEIVIKTSPEGDVVEYVDGVPSYLIGEQLFTWDAMMRYAAIHGKKLPFVNLNLNDFFTAMLGSPGDQESYKYQSFLKINGFKFCGMRYLNSDFVFVGDRGMYWSGVPYNDYSARHIDLGIEKWLRIQYHKGLMMSVRCIL